MTRPVIAENIRTLRRRLSVSQQGLASQIGCSTQAVAFWEAGSCFPRPVNIARLATAFAVTPEQLIGVAPLPDASAGSIVDTALTLVSTEGLLNMQSAITNELRSRLMEEA